MFCLAGIGGRVEGILEQTRKAEQLSGKVKTLISENKRIGQECVSTKHKHHELVSQDERLADEIKLLAEDYDRVEEELHLVRKSQKATAQVTSKLIFPVQHSHPKQLATD